MLESLRARAALLGVARQVSFALSPTSEERDRLFAQCRAVIYTPGAEHFGYVPLEAMAAGRPVVAVNHGGPTETVTHDRTGFLCPPDPQAFAGALATLVTRLDVAQQMGGAARDDVRQRFSIDAFGERLWTFVQPMLPARSSRRHTVLPLGRRALALRRQSDRAPWRRAWLPDLGPVRDLLEREFAQNGDTGAGLERRPYATARLSSDAGYGTFTLSMYISAFHG